jgi:hypothetical protein
MFWVRGTLLSTVLGIAKTRASTFAATAIRLCSSTSIPQTHSQVLPLIPRMAHQQPQPTFPIPEANAPNPFDFYRAYISDVLAGITDLDATDVIRAVQRPQTLEKGDCIIAAPALRIKGKKPDEVATTISNNVCAIFRAQTIKLMYLAVPRDAICRETHCSRHLYPVLLQDASSCQICLADYPTTWTKVWLRL